MSAFRGKADIVIALQNVRFLLKADICLCLLSLWGVTWTSVRGDGAMSEIQALDIRIPAEIIRNWGWFLAFEVGLALLGLVAIARSVTATVVSMLFFGWLLLIAAGIELVQGIMVGKWAGLFQHWLHAALFGSNTVQVRKHDVTKAYDARI